MRKVYSLCILSGFLLAVSGCHAKNPAPDSVQNAVASSASTSDANQPLPQAAPAHPNDLRPVIVCFGDSLTAGLGTDPGQTYPHYRQADLDPLPFHYRVDNQGVSGNTTKDGVDRLPEVLALHPAVVVVEFGGNDGLRGLPIAESRANLDKIVGDLKSSGARVVQAGITLPPDYGPDYVHQFNQTYAVVAKKYRVPMMPFLLKDVYGVNGMMQRDNIHATAKGNEIVARNVVPLVVPFLKK